MNGDHSMLCPQCRRAMVDITRALSWGREKEKGRGEWEEEGNPLFGNDEAPEEEGEKTWECPDCGHREYKK